jgi:hypothetical protein
MAEAVLATKPGGVTAKAYYLENDRLVQINVTPRDLPWFVFIVTEHNAMPNRLSASYDIVTEVRRQLPRVLYGRLMIEVRGDPFHLRTTVRFKEGDRSWECDLEAQREGSRLIACKIPDEFLARLCVEI